MTRERDSFGHPAPNVDSDPPCDDPRRHMTPLPATFTRCAYARRCAHGVRLKDVPMRFRTSSVLGRMLAFLGAWCGNGARETSGPRGRTRETSRPRCVVKVVCAGVNPVDAKYLIGDKLWPWVSRKIGRTCVESLGVGFDFAGVVARADPGSGFAVGDAVFGCAEPGAGAIAEYVDVPADQIASKAKEVSWREGASIGLCAATIAQTLDVVKRPPKTALIVGVSGGLGHIAARVLNAEGVQTIVGVCSQSSVQFTSEVSRNIDVVAYDDSSRSLEDALADRVATHGKFDIVIDTVTSNDARDAACDYPNRLRPFVDDTRGRYVTFGGTPSQWAFAIIRRCASGADADARASSSSLPFADRQRSLQWVYFRGCERQLRYVVDALGVRPIARAAYPFTNEGVRRAMDDLKSRRVKGKIVIDVDPDTIARDDPAIA